MRRAFWQLVNQSPKLAVSLRLGAAAKRQKRCSHYGLGTLNSVAPGLHGGDVVSDLNLLHDDFWHLDGDLARNHLNLQKETKDNEQTTSRT